MTYIVTFISKLKNPKDANYAAISKKMAELVKQQPGYLGMNSVRNDQGEGITVCYWDSLEAIQNWKNNSQHIFAQKQGKSE